MFRHLPLLFFIFVKVSFSMTLELPSSGDIVGENMVAISQPGETLRDVGIRYGIGFIEMVRANPAVDTEGYLFSNTRLVIPSQFVLPRGARQGLVINLAQYRLYYYPEQDNVVMTYPIGIGRVGWDTPLGQTTIVVKQINPKWRPTVNIRAHSARQGFDLPEQFPPGKNNPLGKHVFRLGWPGYLIHGTNHTEGIGERVSAGCIRMLPEDIEYLFSRVNVGTSVRIISEK